MALVKRSVIWTCSVALCSERELSTCCHVKYPPRSNAVPPTAWNNRVMASLRSPAVVGFTYRRTPNQMANTRNKIMPNVRTTGAKVELSGVVRVRTISIRLGDTLLFMHFLVVVISYLKPSSYHKTYRLR